MKCRMTMRTLSKIAIALLMVAAALPAARLFSADQANGDKPADKPKVPLQIANWEETLKLVAAHKGKIVVLDAWSTSCVPCMKEFPNLVRLQKKLGSEGVVCMSMACDYIGVKDKPPEFYRERVLKFLEKQDATFQNVLSNVPCDDLYEKMQLSSIPAVFVFGRDGRLVKRFDNEMAQTDEEGFTYADVTKLIEQLLASKSR